MHSSTGLGIEMQRFIFRLPFDAFNRSGWDWQPQTVALISAIAYGCILPFRGCAPAVFNLETFRAFLLLGMLLDVAPNNCPCRSPAVGRFKGCPSHTRSEIAVMMPGEDAAAVRTRDNFLKPFQHVHVEMVRRFVELKWSTRRTRALAKLIPRLLTARSSGTGESISASTRPWTIFRDIDSYS